MQKPQSPAKVFV